MVLRREDGEPSVEVSLSKVRSSVKLRVVVRNADGGDTKERRQTHCELLFMGMYVR